MGACGRADDQELVTLFQSEDELTTMRNSGRSTSSITTDGLSNLVWMSPHLVREVVSDNPAESRPAYLRVDFARFGNGSVEISSDQIIAFMTMTAVFARHEGVLRVIVVVNMPAARNNYALREIDIHAKRTAEIFRGLKLAYVNPTAKAERIVYMVGVMEQLGDVDCRMFVDERDGLHWLLSGGGA